VANERKQVSSTLKQIAMAGQGQLVSHYINKHVIINDKLY
jgi:hypothetical protein